MRIHFTLCVCCFSRVCLCVVWGVGCAVWVWGVGCGCGVWGVECGVWSVGWGVWGVECGVWGVGCAHGRCVCVCVWLCEEGRSHMCKKSFQCMSSPCFWCFHLFHLWLVHDGNWHIPKRPTVASKGKLFFMHLTWLCTFKQAKRKTTPRHILRNTSIVSQFAHRTQT